MTNDQLKAEFLKKLKDLMTEYRMSIGFSCGEYSDTHGLYDEKIVIYHQPDPNSFKENCVLEVNGWWMTPGDIL